MQFKQDNMPTHKSYKQNNVKTDTSYKAKKMKKYAILHPTSKRTSKPTHPTNINLFSFFQYHCLKIHSSQHPIQSCVQYKKNIPKQSEYHLVDIHISITHSYNENKNPIMQQPKKSKNKYITTYPTSKRTSKITNPNKRHNI